VTEKNLAMTLLAGRQIAAKCKEYFILLFSKIFKSHITIIIINTTITLVVK